MVGGMAALPVTDTKAAHLATVSLLPRMGREPDLIGRSGMERFARFTLLMTVNGEFMTCFSPNRFIRRRNLSRISGQSCHRCRRFMSAYADPLWGRVSDSLMPSERHGNPLPCNTLLASSRPCCYDGLNDEHNYHYSNKMHQSTSLAAWIPNPRSFRYNYNKH